MKHLQILAGKSALSQLQQHGFKQQLFTHFLGASGGPKWFCLYGLDRYMFGQFFTHRQTPLHLIGSSAGAFRFAALAQQDPVAAIARFANYYANINYAANASTADIRDSTYQMLDNLLAANGVDEIINNPVIKANFIVAQSKGLVASESKIVQLAGLSRSYLANRINRRFLAQQYHRYIFTNDLNAFTLDDPTAIPTQMVKLSQHNLRDALYASGAIPLLMSGVTNIAGVPAGTYRDGGIIDYHFDFAIVPKGKQPPLVLYPHFNSAPKSGWFDKSLKRMPHAASYDNVVMLAPTQAFIDLLPYQKIPDRNDFKNLSNSARTAYCQQVLQLSELLAQDFDQWLKQPDLNLIKPINFAAG